MKKEQKKQVKNKKTNKNIKNLDDIKKSLESLRQSVKKQLIDSLPAELHRDVEDLVKEVMADNKVKLTKTNLALFYEGYKIASITAEEGKEYVAMLGVSLMGLLDKTK